MQHAGETFTACLTKTLKKTCMKKILTAVIAALSMAANAAAADNGGSLGYFLPKTAIRMSVLVEKTHTTKGQLAEYSELYFKKPGAVAEQTAYRIVGVRFASVGVADTARHFEVAIDKKHSVFSVDCNSNGVLRAINTKAPRKAETLPFKPSPAVTPPNPRDFMSQDILAAANLPKMAQLVAQEIYDIRDSRNQLSRGEADFMPKDGEQLRLMYANLDRQEAALMQLFNGTVTTDTTETIITIVPQRGEERTVAFRFSKRFGLSAADDFSGEPVYLNVKDDGILTDMPDGADIAKKEKDTFQLGVCLPGRIRLALTDHSGNIMAQYETDAAQYGKVVMLNGGLFGRKFTSQLLMDDTTGSVKELKVEPLE